MKRSRWIVIGMVMAAAWVLCSQGSFAQTPSPNVRFRDVYPGVTSRSTGMTYDGVVIEGRGTGACSTSFTSIEQETVYYLNQNKPTITELSPQTSCASISAYENYVSWLISYVKSNASSTYQQYWGGIMLDEEPSFGYSVASLLPLHDNVRTQVSSVPGVAWWYTEDFVNTGTWCSSTSTCRTVLVQLIGNSVACPQVYNSFMASVESGIGISGQMVTWSSNAGYAPYTTEAASTGAVTGSPYWQPFSTGNTWNWSNHFS